MPDTTATFDVDRSPLEAYAYLVDPTRFPEWQHDVVRVEITRPTAEVVGTLFTTTRRIGNAERTMTQQVTRHEPGQAWAARGVDGLIRPDASVTVEPLDGGTRARVTVTLEFRGHGLGIALLPMVRRVAATGTAASYRRLQQRLTTEGR